MLNSLFKKIIYFLSGFFKNKFISWFHWVSLHALSLVAKGGVYS